MSDIQAQTDLTFVRQEIAASEPPPRSMVGPIGWMRRNLFASVGDTLLTIVGLLLVLYFLPPLLNWAFFDAVWDGPNRDVCISPDAGACWAFIKAKFPQFIYGRYPLGERWRVDIVFFLLAAGILPMAIPSVPYKALNAIFLVGVFPVIAFILLAGGHITFSPLVGAVVYLVLLAAVLALSIRLVRTRPDDVWLRMAVGLLLAFAAISVLGYVVQGVLFGSVVPGWAMFTLLALKAACLLALIALFIVLILVPNGLPAARALAIAIGPVLLAAVLLEVLQADFGLAPVETPLWGGLLVTLVVSYVGIVASLPLGILLALGRRSKMPIVRTFSIAFIELWRGVPLITVLFMASVMLPLFLPPGANFDKLMRALIGVALFASAYMAEVVRGGLQAMPKGQYEASHALGLGYWQTMRLIILPQALKMVIPGIVNTFIGLFKDTSLVYIIGLFDLLGIVRLNFTDTNWASWQTPATGLVFAAFIFWLFCFSMSRYSQFMERRLNTGHKR